MFKKITTKYHLIVHHDTFLRARAWLPAGASIGVQDLTADVKNLTSSELEIGRSFKKIRRVEFYAGRSACKKALEELGGDVKEPILRHKFGNPIWPSGYVGSITHKTKLALAVVGYSNRYAAIGCDLEKEEPLEKKIWSAFISDTEVQTHVGIAYDYSLFANLLFSIKESLFKCIFQIANDRAPKLRLLIPKFTNIGSSSADFVFEYEKIRCEGKVFMGKGLVLSICFALPHKSKYS